MIGDLDLLGDATKDDLTPKGPSVCSTSTRNLG